MLSLFRRESAEVRLSHPISYRPPRSQELLDPPALPDHLVSCGSPEASRPARPLWLVSVRDLDEAALVASAAVDIIDFKEPSAGPLAAVDTTIWHAAAKEFPDRVLSAALGERDSAARLAMQVPDSFRFAKAGPSGFGDSGELIDFWASLRLPDPVHFVPVAYADHSSAGCPAVNEILDAVIATNRRRLLIDTFQKDGKSVFDHLSPACLARVIDRCGREGVWIAIAGSLRLDSVRSAMDAGMTPDCWAVRGDVCHPPSPESDPDETHRRTGRIAADRLKTWQSLLHPSE